MKSGSLTVVGSGIKFMSHLTTEAKIHIQQADKVLYLVNEPAIRHWICENSKEAQSLNTIYAQHQFRMDTYEAITATIMAHLRHLDDICVVVEGHPVVFAKPALDAVVQAKKEGFDATILPGISAEAYLFADLGIDPGSCGCQSYEATDFLIHHRAFDGYSHLILWQVSVIGMIENTQNHCHKKNTQHLITYLSKCYPLNHEVMLYEGSQYPHISSKIKKIPLCMLPDTEISRITTLYIPPLSQTTSDLNMLQTLGMTKC